MRLIILFSIFLFYILNINSVFAQAEESSIHVHAIGWNGENWLIGGRVLPNGPTFLVIYDGREFTSITPTELRDIWIENISWNGKEWVIREMAHVLGSKNRIYTYDGKTLGVGRDGREAIKKEVYEACNENYCLIWKKSDGKLLRYDGEDYIDLTKESGIQFPFENIVIMAWNGEYWLIGIGGTEGGGVLRYDGKFFVSLSLPHSTAANAIVWNGDYWLIGTLANPRFSGSLLRYDGSAIEELTEEFQEALIEKPQKEESPGEMPMEAPGNGKKAVCGPTFMVLFAMLLFVVRRLLTKRL
jgi:hypothetical protein